MSETTYKGLTESSTTPTGAAGLAAHNNFRELADRCERIITVAASDAPQTVKDMAEFECDGTDDDVQIQAALDALPAFQSGARSGGLVRLSSGLFTIGSPVDIRGARTLQGEGAASTQIYLADGADCDMFTSAPPSQEGFARLKDFFAHGNQANNASGGWFWNCTNANLWDSTIEDVVVFRCNSGAVNMAQGWGWALRRAIIEFCNGPGLKVTGSSGPIVESCKIIDNEHHAIWVTSASSAILRIHGSELDSANTGYSALYFDEGVGASALVTTTIFGVPPANGSYQVVLSRGSTLSGCGFFGGGVADSKGIHIDGYNNTVNGCRFMQHTGRVINLHDTGSYSNSLVGNTWQLSTGGIGVYCNGPRNVANSNTMIGGATGIELTSDGDECVVVGNMLDNQLTAAITNNGQSNVVEHNIET